VSLLNPLSLALLGLAAPLLALYFLKLRRQRVKVPSVLLWQEFIRSEQLATPFQKFRRNLLLLLQLLILLLLVLALARPFLAGHVSLKRSVVIVLDSSASMQAIDVKPSRFEAAVEAAVEVIDGLEGADEAMVIEAGPDTRVVSSFSRDKDALRRTLENLSATGAEGSLRDALSLALSLTQDRPDREVIVISDGSGESLLDLEVREGAVRYVRIGRYGANVGITAVDLRRSPVSDLDHELFVTVENFGVETMEAEVEVSLGNELVGRQELVLERDQTAPLVFELAGGQEGTVLVALDAEGDMLPADDEAWALLRPSRKRKVLAVGCNALVLKVLASDPRLLVDFIAPQNYTSMAGYDCAFFEGVVPTRGLEGASYAVLSPTNGGPVTFGAEASVPQVLDWQRSHEVLRFVDLTDLAVARSRRVTTDGTLRTIVESDQGPLMLAGERNGGRVLQLAFDPLKSDLPLRVAFPVLLLNAVSWMTEGTGAADVGGLVATGSLFTLPVPGEEPQVTVVAPSGAKLPGTVAGGLLRFNRIDEVGVYRVDTPDDRFTFAANLSSRRESDIAPMKDLGLGQAATVKASSAAAGRREIWRELGFAAVVILLIEWFAWNRRRTG
jgi:Ca-activated chloride channel homolog